MKICICYSRSGRYGCDLTYAYGAVCELEPRLIYHNGSAPYLKSWLESLKEDAQYIKTILLDVKRASAMITKAIEDCTSQAAKAA